MASNFFEILKHIYFKKRIILNPDMSINIALTKWLSYDKDNLPCIRTLLDYIYYVNPLHYFYLLFFSIPKKFNIPFLKKPERIKPKEDKLLNKIKYVLNWSNRELAFNKSILDRLDKKYWKKELGVK